ncbi:RNA-directed DNA polymerase, eukaryota, reverse transcriptase zinc-binding domain protein [Tanacetum coccineum]
MSPNYVSLLNIEFIPKYGFLVSYERVRNTKIIAIDSEKNIFWEPQSIYRPAHLATKIHDTIDRWVVLVRRLLTLLQLHCPMAKELQPMDFDGGLNIGSLKAKNWALIGKWWWQARMEREALWVRVVKSIYGYEGVAGENMRASEGGRGVWLDIMRVGSDIDKLGIEFSSSFVRKVGDGAHISFWRERWINGGRLMDRFHRLFHLDRHKDGVVADKGNWVEGMWRWVWDWTRTPRGRVVGELEALEACVGNTNILLNCKDSWKWLLAENGIFSVKALTKLIEEKCIDFGNNTGETMWNKLVPKKVNIFMWRVGRGRLPVRVELDKRGIDLHTLLCPSCDEVCETIDHSLVLCNEAMNIWGKVFEWWKIGNVNAFSTNEMFRYAGNGVIHSKYKPLWQAFVWTAGYYIWRNRNCRVFGKKVETTKNLFQEIRLRAFQWIHRRSKEYQVLREKWLEDPASCMDSSDLT